MNALAGLAVAVAHEAGALLLAQFGKPARGVAAKSSGTDMVSDADRDAESLIWKSIRGRRPADAILGEEQGEEGGTSGIRWIVDPLDGTTNYLYGHPHWCISIACEDPDGPLAGVVFDPCRAETFAAARGEGATLNGTAIRVGNEHDLSRALVGTGFGYLVEERAAQAPVVARVLPAVRDIRRTGAAALDLAWTACGRIDAYYESPMNLWDVAAGVLLVREAGGLVTDLPNGGVAASGLALHDELLSLVVP